MASPALLECGVFRRFGFSEVKTKAAEYAALQNVEDSDSSFARQRIG
jgi:hypothetical protein